MSPETADLLGSKRIPVGNHCFDKVRTLFSALKFYVFFSKTLNSIYILRVPDFFRNFAKEYILKFTCNFKRFLEKNK